MTSNYARDPRVPPARVEHLGKHHKAHGHGPVGLPTANAPREHPADPGPTYEDFLVDSPAASSEYDEIAHKTG